MTLGNFSWPIYVGGLAALAAGLFALQRLRVRHRERVVITTLFWQQAVEQTRARVFVQRFRHPWAYLLILAIAALLWTCLAAPVRTETATERHVVLLDRSASMSIGSRFNDSLEQLKAAIQRLPRQTTTVIDCGSQPETVLAPRENRLLLASRMEARRPEPSPSNLEREIRRISRVVAPNTHTTIHVAGVSSIEPAVLAQLPQHVTIVRLAHSAASAADDNHGITALGVAAAATGVWNRVDVVATIRAPAGEPPRELQVTLNEKSYAGPREAPAASGDLRRVLLPDLPAEGQLLRLELLGDDPLDKDDVAQLYLPNRPFIRVTLSNDAPPGVRRAIESDPALQIVNDAPDVRIATNPPADSTTPTLILDPAQHEHAFLFTFDRAQEPADVVRRLFYNLGLDQLDAQEIAQATGTVIRLGAVAGNTRQVRVWTRLMSTEFNFSKSRALPLFVGQAIRWLADQPTLLSHVAAGQPVPGVRETMLTEDDRLVPGGQPFEPPRAGLFESESGQPVAASLLDPSTTGDTIHSSKSAAESTGGRAPFSLVTLLGIVAVGLLFGEWYLFRSGRIP